MHALLGAYYRTLHGLGRYRLLGATLHRWLFIALLLGAWFAWAGWFPGGSTLAPSIKAGLAVAFLALAFFLGGSQMWARRRFYVHFSPASSKGPAVAVTPMPPYAKATALASGLFAVDDQVAAFSGLPAFYCTYPSREHAILARKTPTTFLGLGDADPDLLGMWYIFITPPVLAGVQGGQVFFGPNPRPGLRLEYVRNDKKNRPVAALAYLSFADQPERDRVWADLLVESRLSRELPE